MLVRHKKLFSKEVIRVSEQFLYAQKSQNKRDVTDANFNPYSSEILVKCTLSF